VFSGFAVPVTTAAPRASMASQVPPWLLWPLRDVANEQVGLPIERHRSARGVAQQPLTPGHVPLADHPTRVAVEALGLRRLHGTRTTLAPTRTPPRGLATRPSRLPDAASEAERDAVDVTLATVHVAVWSCAQGASAHRALRENRAARRAAVRARTTVGKDVLARAEAEGARLADTLKQVAAGDAAKLERIVHATRPKAEGLTETGPGQRLASLVAIGRGLAAKDAARAARWKVSGERLDWSGALADEALAAERYDAAPTQGDDARAQAEVDRWDGANLRLLGAIVRAFAHGNKALASVPRLRVVALRHALNLYTKRTKKPAETAKPAEPAKPA
jgi:hypothetical protein